MPQPNLRHDLKSVNQLCSRFPIPDSRFPIPVPLLGGVRGGFRFPIPDSRSPPGRG
ncbi:MAG: hypothetical protein F6K63_32220 [Moorea sp. SIO1G6]|uniref:hypothetical protein n=1 Tax=Moorena sp. SIO1G6 TaxID=2607840 RepID=UPI0013C16D3E|nr:hypothetical protein [Moorena sp. SIO1G6]NET68811.1 hypothetical protein [Moorena sp. SIO1G6]